jgi:2'-5' RNA ligase
MSEQRDLSPRFVALDPDERLSELVWSHKERARQLVGPQLYLDDPPHLTVFLAVFPADVSLARPLESLVAHLSAPRVRLTGWHVFTGDALTGLNTLTCAIDPKDKEILRSVQSRIVETVSPLRDGPATAARFAGRFAHLSAEQQQKVLRHGFPYLGAGWEPHFTVASIRPQDWQALWSELREGAPSGEFTCPHLREYRLIDNVPELVTSLDLAL